MFIDKQSMQSLKAYTQRILRQVGLHERLRASCIYDAYWQVADRSRISRRDRELHFYRTLLRGLRPADLIFDIGANVGEKTDLFLRLGSRVVAVEPDEHNRAVLEEKFLKYRITPKPVTIIGKAVSDRVGSGTMWVDGVGSALNTLSRKWADALTTDKARFKHTGGVLEFADRKTVETTTVEELALHHGVPFFVKIDVEGYELSVLRGMRRPVPYLSFEVNLPDFRQEGLQCLEVLETLTAAGQFNYVADCRCGFALDTWENRQKFSPKLEHCTETSIEVFWRTPLAKRS